MTDARHPGFTAALVLGAAFALALAGTPRAQAPGRAADHVVLISIDGLRPAVYLDPAREGMSVPNLRALAEMGSVAEGVVVSYPSMTYPSHTSLATGARPARHGITSNTKFDPPAGSQAWYFENAAMKVPALWDVAREHGLRTAGASWPVTVGARIDSLFPESNQGPGWLARARAESTPGLVDAAVAHLGGFGENDNQNAVNRDRFTTAVAAHQIRTVQPHLLLVHLMETDSAQHAHGPFATPVRAAFERVDAHVGAIVQATVDAGIRDRTAFVVTGDHGFSRVHALIQPNVVLREGGWLRTDERGRVTADWQVAAHGMAIRLRDPGDTALAARVQARFEELARTRYQGIFRVVPRQELDTHGTYPEAAFFVEPAEGYYVSDGVAGGAVLVATDRRGAHGFLPTEPRLHTGLIVSGAGIKRGVPLPSVRQIDIAPTIGRLLGFDLPEADGTPIVGVLATSTAR